MMRDCETRLPYPARFPTDIGSQAFRKSQLKQPSRIPHMAGLAEISESEGNMRATASSKLPSATTKHRLAGGHEPEAKRKTMAERAGEYDKPAPTPAPASRPPVKATSIVGAAVGHVILL